MSGIIKKLNKKHLVLFLLFVILASLVPLQFAQADLGTIFKGAIKDAILTILLGASAPLLALTILILDIVTGALTLFAGYFLLIVINSNALIPLIPSSGAKDLVTVGFTFTKNLANMGFILILAWVAFATILRIKTYQVKTFLPKLLIIALLINFIPVITGVIIDIADVITKYFVDKSTGFLDQFVATIPFFRVATSEVTLWEELKDLSQYGFIVGVITRAGAGLIFNVITGFIYLIYATLLTMRIVAIWILIILAPLAWLGYIIPAGKKYWNMWWSQFISWTIIAIPMFFFLYLSGYLLGSGISCDATTSPGFLSQAIYQPRADFFCAILPLVANILLLIVGIGLSISLAPMGSKAITSGIKKAGVWAAKTATTKGKSWARERVPESWQRWGARQATAPTWGEGVPGLKGQAIRAATGPFALVRRKVGRLIGPEIAQAQRKAIADAEKSIKAEETVPGIVEKIKDTPDQASKIGYINKLVKEGDIDDALDADLEPSVIKQAREQAKQYDAHKEIDSAVPYMAHQEIVEEAQRRHLANEPRAAIDEVYADMIIKKIKPDRAGQVSKRVFAFDPVTGVFHHPQPLDAMIKTWSGRHFSKFLNEHGTDGAEAIERRIQQLAQAANQAPLAWLQANNPRFLKWMRSTPGQGFFTIV